LQLENFSVFGVSGHKWKFSARAAVATINASFGGGFVGLIYSVLRTKGKFDILDLISAVLGSLVSVTGEFFITHFPKENLYNAGQISVTHL